MNILVVHAMIILLTYGKPTGEPSEMIVYHSHVILLCMVYFMRYLPFYIYY